MLALKAKRSNKTLYLFAAIIVTAIAVIMAERQGVVDSDYSGISPWEKVSGKIKPFQLRILSPGLVRNLICRKPLIPGSAA